MRRHQAATWAPVPAPAYLVVGLEFLLRQDAALESLVFQSAAPQCRKLKLKAKLESSLSNFSYGGHQGEPKPSASLNSVSAFGIESKLA
jgi:hypothetical protein